jgi:uncharacterized protein (TIGR02453 family)
MAVATQTTQAFAGFKPEAIQFLVDLAANNDRAWFQPRKAEYEQLLKEPLEQMIAALAERLEKRGVPLLADPARSPFRIYRDVRFSKDKSPYKTHLGASFPWVGDAPPADVEGRSHAPMVHSSGGYFHLQPGEIYVGGGIWHPDKAWLDAFRRTIAADAGAFHEVTEGSAFRKAFGGISSDGETLQRVPTGYPADHPEAETLKMKNVTFGRRLSDADAMSPSLPDLVAESFESAMPVFRYLASIG